MSFGTVLVGCRAEVILGGASDGGNDGPDSGSVANDPIDAANVIPIDAMAPIGELDAMAPIGELDAMAPSGELDAMAPTGNSIEIAAACSAAATPESPWATADARGTLLVGQRIRCEGVITPNGGQPAPDRQDGLEFDTGGAVGGLLSGSLPLSNGETGPLAYVGGSYAVVSWQFVVPDGGTPSLVFQWEGSAEYDDPVFMNGGTRMTLSDPIWNGTYVRYQ